jgi:hypothetical protein
VTHNVFAVFSTVTLIFCVPVRNGFGNGLVNGFPFLVKSI